MICPGKSSSEIFSETKWKGKYVHTDQCFNVGIYANTDPLNWNLSNKVQLFWKEDRESGWCFTLAQRSSGGCCIGSPVSCKPWPERGDAAELVPLTLHGILDRFDSAAGLCCEEQQFTTEKGVPAVQTQHFSDVERFVCFHTHILSRSFFHSSSALFKLLTADKKFVSHK